MKAKAYIVHQAMCEPELEWSKPKDCLSAEPLYSKRKPLTHEQRVDLLAKFEPLKHEWHASAILIDMVEAAHGITGVTEMNIVIYTKSNCPNCTTAKQLLKSKGLEWKEKNADNPLVFGWLISEHPEARQMPQIFINDQRVGGLAGLQAALKQVGL